MRLVLAGFCAAHHQFAAKELLVVQFPYGAFGFLDALHLHKSEAFRPLVVFVGYNLSVLDLTDPVEELEKVAFSRIEGEIADVKTRRRYFDRFGFTRGPRLRRWSIAIPLRVRRFTRVLAVSAKKSRQPLPDTLLCRHFRAAKTLLAAAIATSPSGTSARTPRLPPV